MNLRRDAVPWWLVPAALALITIPMLAEVYLHLHFSSRFTILLYAVFLIFAPDAILAPWRRRLQRLVAPAPVFAVEHDSGSRAVLETLTATLISDSWSLLVVQSAGLEVWTMDRQPKREGLVPWSSLAGATVTVSSGRWRVDTVELLWHDGRAIYLDVRVSVFDRIRRTVPNAAQLAVALGDRLAPGHPDPVPAPLAAQTD